ncbi:MAG: hypothetical protein EB060_12480 [Proteobacteria bacterium]|nr:hypothetical protein [Pseudomonadota bacterium]
MASEITINCKFQVVKGSLVHREDPGSVSLDMSGTTATGGAQSITTTAATLNMGSVSTAGYAFFRNTDTSNSIDIGTGTGASFAAFSRLKPGEFGIIRLGTNAPTAKAVASTVSLQYYILAD